jgi:hypothetical protein
MYVLHWDSNKINLDPVENMNQMNLGGEPTIWWGLKMLVKPVVCRLLQ